MGFLCTPMIYFSNLHFCNPQEVYEKNFYVPIPKYCPKVLFLVAFMGAILAAILDFWLRSIMDNHFCTGHLTLHFRLRGIKGKCCFHSSTWQLNPESWTSRFGNFHGSHTGFLTKIDNWLSTGDQTAWGINWKGGSMYVSGRLPINPSPNLTFFKK